MDKGFKIAFASEITLYAAAPNKIYFGSSGSFNPTVRESYWRTIHAASILKRWELATKIINLHCNMYADLEKQIFELNN